MSALLTACLNSEPADEPLILSDPLTGPVETQMTPPMADVMNDMLSVDPAPQLRLTLDNQTLEFDWDAPVGAVTTRILIHQIDTDTYDTIATLDNTTSRFTLPVAAHTLDWGTQYVLEHCSSDDCIRSHGTSLSNGDLTALNGGAGRWITSTRSNAYDAFGSATAMALEGRVLITGAPGSDVLNSRTNDVISDAGALHLYYALDDSWVEAAQLVADQPVEDAELGSSLDISADGDTIVATTQSATLVFERFGEGYVQLAEFDHPGNNTGNDPYNDSGNDSGNNSGTEPVNTHPQVQISRDGSTIITSVADAMNSQGHNDGIVLVHRRVDGQWMQVDVLENFDVNEGFWFGRSMALSDTGHRIFISAIPSSVPAGETAMGDGRVYLFESMNDRYVPAGMIVDSIINNVISQTDIHFAESIETNATGDTLLVTRRQSPTTSAGNSQLRFKSVAGIVLYERLDTENWVSRDFLIPTGNHSAASQIIMTASADARVVSAALTDNATMLIGITTWVRFNDGYHPQSVLANPDSEATGFADNLNLSSEGTVLAVGAPLRRNAGTSRSTLFAGAVRIY